MATIRAEVKIGQQWQSNDPRRLAIVQVEHILGYEEGQRIMISRVLDPTSPHRADRVRVRNIVTGKVTTIRRDQFTTGVRGWSLHKEA